MVFPKSVLVTGILGFIGRNVANYYASLGWRVIGIDALAEAEFDYVSGKAVARYYQHTLKTTEELIDIINIEKPSVCVHAAGSSDVGLSFKQPLSDYYSQVSITYVLLEAIRQSQHVLKTVIVSSAAVYGEPEKLPVKETALLKPMSPYGYHKISQEKLAQQFHDLYNQPIVIARLFSTFGPGQKKLAVWDITQRALAGDLSVFGDGRQTRDYLYIDDVAKALFILAESSLTNGNIYNIGSGVEMSIEKVAQLIGLNINPDLEINYLDVATAGNPCKWCADVSKIQKVGFKPEHDFVEALARTISWIKNVSD